MHSARVNASWSRVGLSSRLTSAAVVVGLHAAVVVVLLQFESVRNAVLAAAPVMVTLISPPREKPVVPPPPPPKPRVQPKAPVHRKVQSVPEPPIMTAPAEATSTYTAPPPPPPVEVPEAPVAVAPEPAPAPVTPPRFNAAYLNNPPPVYPLEARQMGEQGRVVLRVFVNERGLPDEVQVRTSSGFSRLDGIAQDTVRRWKFAPARRGDTPVGAWVLVPMTFSLST